MPLVLVWGSGSVFQAKMFSIQLGVANIGLLEMPTIFNGII
jgi:hypothetical protein